MDVCERQRTCYRPIKAGLAEQAFDDIVVVMAHACSVGLFHAGSVCVIPKHCVAGTPTLYHAEALACVLDQLPLKESIVREAHGCVHSEIAGTHSFSWHYPFGNYLCGALGPGKYDGQLTLAPAWRGCLRAEHLAVVPCAEPPACPDPRPDR